MKRIAVASLLISAFLLFYVQPFIAHLILPYFGSGASVWIVCLSFFQILLLCGYLYTDLISKTSHKTQAVVHGVLVFIALLVTFRIGNIESVKSYATIAGLSESPTFALFKLLLLLIGPSYFILSTNGPLMQSWVNIFNKNVQTNEKRKIYRLYALSNVGSFIGLFAFPLIIEPFLSLQQQSIAFTAVFVIYALFTITASICLLLKKDNAKLSEQEHKAPQNEVGNDTVFNVPLVLFLLISFASTFFLMSATLHLTIDIPPIPLLWVILLGLYLLSFTFGFSSLSVKLLPMTTTLAFFLLIFEGYVTTGIALKRGLSSFWQILTCSLLLFLSCLALNTWLFKLRPSHSRLPRFYLMLSVGGALAGVVSSFVFPILCNTTPEYPISIILVAVVLTCLVTMYTPQKSSKNMVAMMLPLVVVSVLVGIYSGLNNEPALWRGRDFYGSLAVRSLASNASQDKVVFKSLYFGNTSHGSQMWSDDGFPSNIPISCFSDRSGIGRYLNMTYESDKAPKKIGIIGLGIGTLASYGKPGDSFRYYEIAPLVIDAATNTTWFTFLSDSKARVEYILGDARLSMANEYNKHGSQNYDFIIADAFASDSIPTHLLTIEAFKLYKSHLKENGIIAVNLTNRYLNLMPVAKAAAKEMGWNLKVHISQGQGMIVSSLWVFLSQQPLEFDVGQFGLFVPENSIKNIPVWTDDYCSILPLLKWH